MDIPLPAIFPHHKKGGNGNENRRKQRQQEQRQQPGAWTASQVQMEDGARILGGDTNNSQGMEIVNGNFEAV